MVIMIDLDGTICHELSPFERPLAEPLPGAVDGVNRIKDQGHTVVIWTGRGWDQYRITGSFLLFNFSDQRRSIRHCKSQNRKHQQYGN